MELPLLGTCPPPPATPTHGERKRSSIAGEDQREGAERFQEGGPRDPESNAIREISRGMVKLYKEQFGRGPEVVTTHYSGPDVIVSILGNSLTPVERTMRDMGEQQRLRDIRLMFQHATEPKFRAAVEQRNRATRDRLHERHRCHA